MPPDQSRPGLGLHHSGLGVQAAREHGGAGVATVQDVEDLVALGRVTLLHLVLLCTSRGFEEGGQFNAKKGFCPVVSEFGEGVSQTSSPENS